jgi:hypothetical protein
MDMQSGEWICMDTLMDEIMDNAEIRWVDIYVYDKWISAQIVSGYSWICLDTTDN